MSRPRGSGAFCPAYQALIGTVALVRGHERFDSPAAALLVTFAQVVDSPSDGTDVDSGPRLAERGDRACARQPQALSKLAREAGHRVDDAGLVLRLGHGPQGDDYCGRRRRVAIVHPAIEMSVSAVSPSPRRNLLST